MPRVRSLGATDHAALLQINGANVPAVAPLDAAELQRLAAIGDLHRIAVDERDAMLGYTLAFTGNDAYDGEEFRQFRTRLAQPFVYVDQIATAASGRRQGVGRALYDSVLAEARVRQCTLLCCEVNTIPPNPGSMAFHLRLGFRPFDSIAVSDGRTVALLTRDASRFS
jgi:predicted GNAT superfamily acetyltransferase